MLPHIVDAAVEINEIKFCCIVKNVNEFFITKFYVQSNITNNCIAVIEEKILNKIKNLCMSNILKNCHENRKYFNIPNIINM